MNDFEQKLARQNFREPPAALRAEILHACTPAAPTTWTWRDWLWPSPQAWAALAALWLIFAALGLSDRPAAPVVVAVPDSVTPAAHLTVHNTRDFRHVLELTN